jgi:hypothetical protein
MQEFKGLSKKDIATFKKTEAQKALPKIGEKEITKLGKIKKRKEILEAEPSQLAGMAEDVKAISKETISDLDRLQAEIEKDQAAKNILKNAPELSEEAIASIDDDIKSKKAEEGQIYYDYKSGTANIVGGLAPATNVPAVERKYDHFKKEKAQVIAELKRSGQFEKTSKAEILNRAADLYKKNALIAAKENMWRDYLENNADVTEKTRSLLKEYGGAKTLKAQLDLRKNIVLAEESIKAAGVAYKEYEGAIKDLKPKGYKFETQQEVDEENAKIAKAMQLADKVRGYEAHAKKYRESHNNNVKNVEDASLELDMLKRDYSYSGALNKVGRQLQSWGLDALGVANMLTGIPQAIATSVLPDDIAAQIEQNPNYWRNRGIEIAEARNRNEEYISEYYAKSREITDIESFMENTWDGFTRFAPDLLLMAATGGGSAAGKKIATEGSKSLLKSAFKKATLNKASLANLRL